jgi:hypothetical protein
VKSELATRLPENLKVAESFVLGVLTGPSGSGKTQVVRRLLPACREPQLSTLDSRTGTTVMAALAQVPNCKGADTTSTSAWARTRLECLQLGYLSDRPLDTLSSGELARVRVAGSMQSGTFIDEFCSHLDRETACHFCALFARAVRKLGLKSVVVASANADVAPWLVNAEPADGSSEGAEAWRRGVWVYSTESWGELRLCNLNCSSSLPSRGSAAAWPDGDYEAQLRLLRSTPRLKLTLRTCSRGWFTAQFASHHYLGRSIVEGAVCMLARIRELGVDEPAGFSNHLPEADGEPVGLVSAMSATRPLTRREHRLVVLPDWQVCGTAPECPRV